MSSNKQPISRREQRHRERVRRWRIRRLKSFLANFAIIAFAAGAIFGLQFVVDLSAPEEEEDYQAYYNDEEEEVAPPEEDTSEEEDSIERVTLPIVQSAPSLSDGEVMTLTENCIRKNKEFTFTANVDQMGVLTFRHGDNVYGSSWINLDRNRVEVYTHYNRALLQADVAHGLSFGGKLKVVVSVNAHERMSLTITSRGQEFSLTDIPWLGYRGMVEVESIGNELTDVTATWDALDTKKDVWVLGDGYLGTHARNKWPYYVLQEGYDNVLYSGVLNVKSEKMYEEWRRLLAYGTPKYAVWTLGAYESDSEEGVNETWNTYFNRFLDDCEELNITPILATIPNTVKKNHEFKNEIVRTSGYRYVDFALVVGASKKDSVWLGGMQSGDGIHPSNSGAEALAGQFLKDVPEIKGIPEEEKTDQVETDEAPKTEE